MATDVGTTLAARFIAAFLLLALLLFALLAAGRGLMGVLFEQDPRFTLRNLTIETGNSVSAEAIRQVTGIREGDNLFRIHLARVRRDFLRNLPNIRDIRIERRLPDSLRITVHERMPIARLGRSGRMVTDFDGYLFSLQPGRESLADTLPVLASEEWANLQPGQRLGKVPRAALTVLDAADAMRLPFRIAEVDTTNPHYLLLQTTERLEIRFPWPAVQERQSVAWMLGRVGAVLAAPQSAGKNRFDVDPDDGRVIAGYQ